MKKLTNTVSPFIMLLVPLFLLLGVLAMNINNEIPPENHRVSVKLQVPSFKSLVEAVMK